MQYLWQSMGLEKKFMAKTIVAYDVANIMYDSVTLLLITHSSQFFLVLDTDRRSCMSSSLQLFYMITSVL